jgi:glycosyltransferase involved in cell wall biosynthesis
VRVLHVIPSLAAADGGPAIALRVIERAVAAEGIDVETATTDADGSGRMVGKLLEVPVQEEDVVRRYFRRDTVFYKVSLQFRRWLRKHVADYDIVHIHALFSFVSTIAARAAWRSGVPYVVRPLGVLGEYGMTTRRPTLKRVSLRLIEQPILERAAAVHFTSDLERREADALGCAMRSVVIPLAVPMSEMKNDVAPASATPYVLFLSRLDPKKNVEGLLRAFALLVREDGLQLVVAGGGEIAYVQALRALAEHLGVASAVRWTGHVTGAAKEELLLGAHAFALPSYSENFGMAAAEALAAGIPCVLGQGVALAQRVQEREAGVMVSPDPEAIASGLRKVLSSARAGMAANARALAREEFSVAVMGRRLRKLYEQVLAERR